MCHVSKWCSRVFQSHLYQCALLPSACEFRMLHSYLYLLWALFQFSHLDGCVRVELLNPRWKQTGAITCMLCLKSLAQCCGNQELGTPKFSQSILL